MKIRRFEPDDRAAITRLNQRLAAAGATDVVYPEGREQQAGPVRERLFVADDDGEIRGGVWLKEHAFRAAEADVTCGWLKYPVAESLVDQRFSAVPGSLLLKCLREQPRLMALGLGGHGTPLARMLARLKWTGVTVPLQLRLVRPARAIRELGPMRRSAARRAAGAALGLTGAAWLGARALDVVRRTGRARATGGCVAETVDEFGSWADVTWQRCRDAYGFLAARDSSMLAAAFPPVMTDVRRLRIRRSGTDVGWACVLRHDFSSLPDPNFGHLTVGLLADGLALPADVQGVAAAALDYLEAAGTDVVFANQLHPAWRHALAALGFVGGPSTFAFYRAPSAEALIAPAVAGPHVNRGDCDGPVWYRVAGTPVG